MLANIKFEMRYIRDRDIIYISGLEVCLMKFESDARVRVESLCNDCSNEACRKSPILWSDTQVLYSATFVANPFKDKLELASLCSRCTSLEEALIVVLEYVGAKGASESPPDSRQNIGEPRGSLGEV